LDFVVNYNTPRRPFYTLSGESKERRGGLDDKTKKYAPNACCIQPWNKAKSVDILIEKLKTVSFDR
jgi:hypothetical protein